MTKRVKVADIREETIKPIRLAHVVVRTRHFEESKRFYSALLNAKVAFENEQISFMTYDDEHHRIGIINMPQLEAPEGMLAGIDHFAFTYESMGVLLANYVRLKKEGIEPYWCINHGPTISFYYRDPDGTKIETQCDVFDDLKDLDEFFESGRYEENFVGIIIEPEKLLADYEAGVSMEELTFRPTLPPGQTPWDMARL